MIQSGLTNRSFLDSVLDFIFPPTCAGCGATGSLICANCENKFVWIKEPICVTCGQPTLELGKCAQCTKVPPAIDQIRAPILYTEGVTRIIHNLKYYDQFALAKPLAQLMSAAVPQFKLPFESNLILPIPLHKKREKERGYNQAGLLAKELGKLLNLPVSQNALRRVRQTESQAKLTREERMENMSSAFEADGDVVQQKHILLIDDVCTTGATLFAAAAQLKAAGACSVSGLCVARALKL